MGLRIEHSWAVPALPTAFSEGRGAHVRTLQIGTAKECLKVRKNSILVMAGGAHGRVLQVGTAKERVKGIQT